MISTQIIGNLGRDAELKTVGEKQVINFSLAHTDKRKDGEPITIWIDCAYWTDRHGILEYLTKGTQVFVEGQPSVRTYTNKEGEVRASLTLRIRSIQLLGHPGRNEDKPATQPPVVTTEPQADDLPF